VTHQEAFQGGFSGMGAKQRRLPAGEVLAVSVVTFSDLVSGFRGLGLAAGDMVMVHSSLSSFGHVEGGAPTVVSALLEVLTEGGTLVVPTFSKYSYDEPVWDREHTPSLMGAISETVRAWPGALRSSHAAHPLSAGATNRGPAVRRSWPEITGANSRCRTRPRRGGAGAFTVQ
jgi:aminoglycoside N3'-acetyltransferase